MARSKRKRSPLPIISLLFIMTLLMVGVADNSSAIFSRAQQAIEQKLLCPSPSAEGTIQMIPCAVSNPYDPYAPPTPTKKPSPTGGADSGSVGGGGYVPPNTNNCGGKAKLNKTFKKNFGEPKCNFDKDKLFSIIKQKDSANATMWFTKIAPCESGYNTNAYADTTAPGQAKLDAGGAWGLFQMGSSKPPGKAPPSPGKNGPLDRGDVNYEMQVKNAVDYKNSKLGGKWTYWACAKSKK